MNLLIFSGYNSRAVITLCRLLSEYNLPFGIIANGVNDEIFKTSYKNRIIYINKKESITIELILELNKKKEDTFIFPTTEFLNRLLIKNKDELNKHKIFFGLCDEKIYELVSDKYPFSNLCKSNGIAIPIEFNSIPTVPYVIKPKTYFNNNSLIYTPQIIFDKNNGEKFLSDKNVSDFYFQEFVVGESVYFLFYISKYSKSIVYSQKNYLQQKNGKSITLAKSSNHYKEEIAQKLIKLFKEISFFGIVMVEFRKKNNDWIVIEANPRFWGPSQLVLDSGMQIFDYFLFENKIIDKKIIRKYKTNIPYVYSKGMNNDFMHAGCESYKFNLKFDIYNRKDTIKVFNG